MQKGELFQIGDAVIKILAVERDEVLVIDCKAKTMPRWKEKTEINEAVLLR